MKITWGTHHADFAVGKREAFCTVRERHWAFSRGVERRKDVDEKSNKTKMGRIALRNEEAQSSSKQGPSHLREGKQEQAATTKCVYSPNDRPSKHEVDETEAKRGNKRFSLGGVRLSEDGARVESDDIDYIRLALDHCKHWCDVAYFRTSVARS